ncbi:uncharacterized protein LOC120007386 [Tripterygium wilfordii]|uniref:uncharacterized protein LOC120007386 n=1 Tax=Tripterygium wilfordii TaxID=458696 RepID=UPI0018F82D17|nr:uncharacterized protein LOC120007386 [Tripterygium wilfordii]
MAYVACTCCRQSLHVQSQLKRLNKSPLKSIKSPDGDIIDCIHIYDRPAFDHPLLKNNKIQKRPALHPKITFGMRNVSVKPITQLWQLNGECLAETILIRRTRKRDILRAGSIQAFGKKKYLTFPLSNTTKTIPGQNLKEYAIAYRASGRKYYGAKASLSIWNPRVEQRNEFSVSQIWVYNQLYGDNNTRLFIYWTSDRYVSTGCYNLLCKGFIQENKEIVLGGTLTQVSVHNGVQHDLKVYIFQDPMVGNWWLQYGDKMLGYWPSSLFTYLNESATSIVNRQEGGQHTTTEMGSGRFPIEGLGNAAYFKHIQYLDQEQKLKDARSLHTVITRPTCYDLRIRYGGEMKTHFYHGGPGRNPDCP